MSDIEHATQGTSAPKYPAVLAVLCLLAGLGIGLLALAGPLTVWTGLGDFRQGFGLLRIANSWAAWIAGVGVLVAMFVFVVTRSNPAVNGGRLSAMALLGAICAGLAWYVPQTFRPAEGVPVIHDIATDPYNPPAFVAIAPLRADAPNNMEYGVMPGIETVQEHIDLQREAYPDIVPQAYDSPPATVFDRALAAIDTLGWEVVAADAESGRIEATDTTFWFRFKDDVVIEIAADGAGGSVLQARSTSRVGRGDVGKNAARLREFFRLMQDNR